MKTRFLALLLAALSACLLLLLPAVALACPAYPGEVEVDDGSGGTVTVRNYGDEFFSYTADTDGNLLFYNSLDGCYYYVVYDGDAFALGERVGGGQSFWGRFRKEENRPRVNLSGGADGFKEKLSALQAESGERPYAFFQAASSATIPDNYEPNADARNPLFGKIKYGYDALDAPQKGETCALLVLKVQFADIKCQFSDAVWHKRIFDDGVSGYYSEVSNGKFTYVPARESYGGKPEDNGRENDGVITVTLPIDRPGYCAGYNPYVAGAQNYGFGAKLGFYEGTDGKRYAMYSDASIFAYALNAADAYIDFSRYDRNNDGYVSPTELAVLVVAAGYEAAYVGEQAGRPMTWAHSWNANTWFVDSTGRWVLGDALSVQLDGVGLYKYTIMGENLNGSFDYSRASQAEKPRQAQFGTACHELGHDLGLMDLYATDGSAQACTVDMLSLMGAGNWASAHGEESGSSPTHLDPYSKAWLDFFEPVTASEAGVYPVTEASDAKNYRVLRVNTDDPDVYYLIENRTFMGFDRGLDSIYGAYSPGGVVYWRINEKVIQANWQNNSINNHSGNYGVMPVYPRYVYEQSQRNQPFRNKATYDAYEKAHMLVSNPKTTLTCYDTAAATMNGG